MRRRIALGALSALGAAVFVGAAYGGPASPAAKPTGVQGKRVLPASACSNVYYRAPGRFRFIIASDLPLQGANRPQTTEMNRAIQFLLRQRKFRAGRYRIGFQACDDSTAQRGAWDSAKCTSNARAYVEDRTVIGVVGTFNSGCAKLEIPILNRANLAMVSPANTAVGLTVSGLGSSPGEPRIYYPNGRRNYARVVARDDIQGPAGAMLARSLRVNRVYVLTDRETYGLGVANTFATGARRLGLRVVGGPEAWDPRASSYEGLANKIKASNAQAVYLGGIVCNNGVKLIKDLRDVLGAGVRLIGPDGWTPFSAVAAAGSAAEGMYITVPGVPPEALRGRGRTFVRAFQRTQGGKKLASYTAYAAQAADVLLTAIARSNGTRASVSRNLFGIRVRNGILGTFRIDRNGDTNLAGITGYVMRRGDGRTYRTFYPPARLTRR